MKIGEFKNDHTIRLCSLHHLVNPQSDGLKVLLLRIVEGEKGVLLLGVYFVHLRWAGTIYTSVYDVEST